MTAVPAVPAPRFAVPEQLDAAALEGSDPGATVFDLRGETMGTRWSVRLALSANADRTSIQRAIQHRLDGIVSQMSHWQPTSLLSHYNAAPAGTWTLLPDDFATVIRCALDVAARSNGAFDPALGRLTDLWGLGARPAQGVPADDAIRSALAASGWRRVASEPAARWLHQPGGLWLDLSGIAKGYAVDAVADMLAGMGLRHALVEIGGECVGRGMRPDGDPWWVEAETPPGFDLPPLRVALHQLAIATSGHYLGGAHTIDAATGRPPLHPTIAVSVVHPSCMMADAWASALCVLSPDDARRCADREGLAARLLGRAGDEWLSRRFTAML